MRILLFHENVHDGRHHIVMDIIAHDPPSRLPEAVQVRYVPIGSKPVLEQSDRLASHGVDDTVLPVLMAFLDDVLRLAVMLLVQRVCYLPRKILCIALGDRYLELGVDNLELIGVDEP